jgi:hypothetical protein
MPPENSEITENCLQLVIRFFSTASTQTLTLLLVAPPAELNTRSFKAESLFTF